ncbi:hypothetical protein ES288_A04G160600v1 [Gossypium darwinii]|uniref:Uncharacterized protein n=1 Tax=Gossypium darwinii TaxID=34276 RepID=A0A5D2GY85_GOSDA|nr:hypothetical protein ES288_A04G160600v1 [Gossypium darwinii]
MQQEQEQEQSQPLSLLDDIDALYCEEEEDDGASSACNNGGNPFFPLDQDLFWDDEELLSMFSKEITQNKVVPAPDTINGADEFLAMARCVAVEWVLQVNARYGFTTLTAVLAINYLDRFLSSFRFQSDNKPWLIHLVAVTCLSLAAKVEETQVPLLLDLQVEDIKYVFEAKTIQRMEILILTTLKWKMNPITPLSFIDHIIRRLGLKTHLHWEFLKRCEHLLLCVISDSSSMHYLPSVLATATMMHVIDQVEPFTPIDYQNQLLDVLKIKKERVSECYNFVVDVSNKQSQKRKINRAPSLNRIFQNVVVASSHS